VVQQSTQPSDSQVETFWDENYNKMLDSCYVNGIRYCRFCGIDGAIRTHVCYDASEFQELKKKHTILAHRVLSILEEATHQMDIQEELSAQLHGQQRKELDCEAQIRLEHWQQEIQLQKQSNSTNQTTVDVQQSRFQTPVSQLQVHYKRMYHIYQRHKKIMVYSIDTYQGHTSESTNGCTVISALIVAHHLKDSTPRTRISKDMIKDVVDTQCGPILCTIRRKLGLRGHALIIPSDAHDHLVDAKILHQEYFVGASAGNIMDPQHYSIFLKLLSDSDHGSSTTKTSNGKAGTTLYFHGHVISIVKFTDATTNQIYFDLIDSMPKTCKMVQEWQLVRAAVMPKAWKFYCCGTHPVNFPSRIVFTLIGMQLGMKVWQIQIHASFKVLFGVRKNEALSNTTFRQRNQNQKTKVSLVN
jgi:hypothetical protein